MSPNRIGPSAHLHFQFRNGLSCKNSDSIDLHVNLTENDDEGTQWITKLTLYIKSPLRCCRRRQNLRKWFAERMLSWEITFQMHYLNLVHSAAIASLNVFYISRECDKIRCINTHTAMCCLSKDPFQQMLWHGKLHERASLGCLLEWQWGPCKIRKSCWEKGGRNFVLFIVITYSILWHIFIGNSYSISIFRALNFGTRRKGTESVENFLSRLEANARVHLQTHATRAKFVRNKNTSNSDTVSASACLHSTS